MSLTLRRAAAISAGALALSVVAATPALASIPTTPVTTTTSLTFQCAFPRIGAQPLTLTLATTVPEPVQRLTKIKPTGSGQLVLGGSAAEALAALPGSVTISGVAEAEKPGKSTAFSFIAEQPGGTPFESRVPLTLTPWSTGAPPSFGAVASFSSYQFDSEGEVDFTFTELVLNLKARDAAGQPVPGFTTIGGPVEGDGPGNVDIDGDPNTFNVACTLAPPTQNRSLTTLTVVDNEATAPSKPGDATDAYGPEDVTCNAFRVRWKPSTQGSFPVKEYRVTYEGGPAGGVRVPGDQTSVWITGLGADSFYDFSVTAIDTIGNESQALVYTDFLTLDGCEEENEAPTRPGAPVPSELTATSVTLTWTASQDDVGVVGYHVLKDGVKITTVTGTTATINGLAPGTTYAFSVVAVDAEAVTSLPSTATPIKTNSVPPESSTIRLSYALTGSTQLKTLTKGTLPLSGGIVADFDLLVGDFTADLTLADTTGKLVAAGFLPVTAKIGFAPSGKTTGTLSATNQLTTNSKVRIKVREVKLFGAIPLAGGNNCQSRELSEITLKNTAPKFKPLVGGPIAGTYKISNLNGCGALNGLVSPLTAGAGNTINLTLTPKTATS